MDYGKTPKRERLFWQKVNKSCQNGCWEWTGCIAPQGYGAVGTMEGGVNNRFYAHRVSYMWYKGNVDGLFVRHTCDNRKCVNPDHLLIGTHQQNMDDMVERDRHVGFRKLKECDVVKIREERHSGVSCKEISDKYYITPQQVSSICVGKFWIKAGGPLTRRKETDRELVLKVKACLEEGFSEKECADIHDISKSLVNLIKNGKKDHL